ncbi:MAG: NAD(P)-dependent oxidoreductase [Geminicoccaceae bacterium]
MRVLVTGHDGYIGQVLVPLLKAAGHEPVGLDSFFFAGCDFPGQPRAELPVINRDVRDVTAQDLAGFDAVLHLAGLSNDPLGDLDAELTYDINLRGSVRVAQLAKAAGVERFVFASSCSNYGASGDDYLDETGELSPVTPYAKSKVMVEEQVAPMADDSFTPVFLRAATAYGMSSKLRGDLVVNNLIGYAITSGEVLIKSDGMPWRPLVHIEDIARAYLALLEAPASVVRNEAFNVGKTSENYRVREVADMVAEIVPNCRVTYAPGASPDKRNYRVNCDKIRRLVPAYQPQWTLRRGIEQIYAAYRDTGLTGADFAGPRYMRLQHIRNLIARGELDGALRWRRAAE